MIRRFLTFIIVAAICCAMASCHTAHPSAPSALAPTSSPVLADAHPLPTVDALVAPPVGWKPEPLKASGSHHHQVWLSPTGKTAYGVIYFSMPLPVGADLALSGFLRNMKKSEGEARLLDESHDASLPGIRFVAQGGLYRVRTNLIVRGFHGWAVYAGTLAKDAIVPSELEIAEQAREHTSVGLGAN